MLPTLYSHIYLQFSSLFVLTDLSKCEIRNQGAYEESISRLYILLDLLIYDGTAKTKLAMLAFLYYGMFMKNSTENTKIKTPHGTSAKVLRLESYSVSH